jgi:phage terminase large subunit-like protein
MARKKDNEEDFDPVAFVAAGLADSARKPNNLLYKPHPKQLLFHASQKLGRQYIGGNRSGKTTGGINEDIWWLRGQHPYRSVPEPPVIGRITTVDFKNGATKIIIPNLVQWIPPSLLINGSWSDSYNGATHTLHLSNKSELEIMSYDQELEKFAGVPRHFIHFDEEPPKDIFNECKARLIDYGGSWWITETPVEGMTWTFDEIYDKAKDGTDPLIDVIQVAIQENTYLKPEAIIDFLSGQDEDGISIRGTGKYIAIGGLVFKHYDPDRHVISPGIPPPSWTHYMSLDAGYNNPTAVHWHAVSPSGEVVTYYEHYRSEMTVEQHAEEIKSIEAGNNNRGKPFPVSFLRIADPAIRQRSAITGLSIQIEYAQHGINLALGTKRDVNAGLDKMNNYLRLDKWFITEDCPNLQKEMRTYKRSQYATSKLREKNNKKEEPQKKNDHAIDGSRYFFSYMPELVIEEISKNPRLTREQVASLMGAGTTFDQQYPVRVDNNLISSPAVTIIHDEYVGEW